MNCGTPNAPCLCATCEHEKTTTGCCYKLHGRMDCKDLTVCSHYAPDYQSNVSARTLMYNYAVSRGIPADRAEDWMRITDRLLSILEETKDA